MTVMHDAGSTGDPQQSLSVARRASLAALGGVAVAGAGAGAGAASVGGPAGMVVAVLVTLWLVVPLLRLAVDEMSVPADRAARAVPSGVEVVTSEEQCGSGGCWRDLTLRWPCRSTAELCTRLGLAPNGTTQRCRAASFLDRR